MTDNKLRRKQDVSTPTGQSVKTYVVCRLIPFSSGLLGSNVLGILAIHDYDHSSLAAAGAPTWAIEVKGSGLWLVVETVVLEMQIWWISGCRRSMRRWF